ncbi:MAG: signal peptide peptidase SppA [Pseudomonadota bacterium]
MRRLFTFWRIVALLALALAAYAILDLGGPSKSGPHVARHDVFGVIYSDPERDALIRDMAEDPDVKALIVRIDSPGGTVTGAETLFEAIRAVAAEKPVVALMGEVAASGGYLAAIAADHVLTRGNTLTGSIGVVKQQPDVQALLDSLGVEMKERRSDVYKARPSPFSDTPPEVEAWEDRMIEESYAWFRGLVGERRGLEGEALDSVADGRVFTGRMALERGLVDAIGGPEAARAWLEGQGVSPDLPVFEAKLEEEPTSLLLELLGVRLPAGLALERLGLERLTSGPRLYAIMR